MPAWRFSILLLVASIGQLSVASASAPLERVVVMLDDGALPRVGPRSEEIQYSLWPGGDLRGDRLRLQSDAHLETAIRNASSLGETLRIVVEVGCPTEESFANVQTAIERLRKIAAASARTGCPVEIVIHAGRAAYPSIPKAGDPAEDRTDVSVSRLLDEYDKAKDR